MKFSARSELIEPFYVMEVSKAAQALALEAASHHGPEIIRLNIGEPDFTAPLPVQQAAERAIRGGLTQYTPAVGLEYLREGIAAWYARRFGVQVAAERIVVTAGASAALQLACLALLDAGDEVLTPDPGYPCNRHFIRAADAVPVLLPTTAAQRWQPDAQQVRQAWTPRTRGVLLASPSNPTGTSIDPQELRRIHAVVQEKGGFTIVDEIYLGLSYDEAFGQTALALDDNIISINSFSKYFCMTGWRLGWMVVPQALVPVLERLAQNLFICPSTVAQHAALACFEPESLRVYEERRAQFRARRDWLVPELNALGMPVSVMPDGAFYAWADCRLTCERLGVQGSWDFAFALLRQSRIALSPGRDFGTTGTAQHVRFSYASSLEHLRETVDRLRALMG